MKAKFLVPWVLLLQGAPGQQQPAMPPPKPAADRLTGEWRFNLSKSKLASDDQLLNEVRIYSREGVRTKVAWSRLIDGRILRGEYVAKCDGVAVPLGRFGKSVCWYTPKGDIEGELRDERDPKHVYYRCEVSADGKTMAVLWFRDPTRTRVWTARVYDRALE